MYLANSLRQLRKTKALPLRVVAAYLEVDSAVLSKIERGLIIPSKVQVLKFAEFFSVDAQLLLKDWLSDKVYKELKDEDLGMAALKVCEERLLYANKQPKS